MKTRKILRALCAVSMLLTSAVAATAAEPVTENAGKTNPLQVVEETENGLVSRIIEVAIPEGATEAEKNDTINAAAFGPSVPTRSSMPYLLSSMSNIDLTPEEQKVGGGDKMLSGYNKYEQITINISVKSASNTNTRLYFEVRDATNPDMSTSWQDVSINATEIVFGTKGLPSKPGKAINVYAKTSDGCYATLSSCRVYAVAYFEPID